MRPVFVAAIWVGVLAIRAAGCYAKLRHNEAEAKRRSAAQAVSILPPGAEEQWTAYVDRRLV